MKTDARPDPRLGLTAAPLAFVLLFLATTRAAAAIPSGSWYVADTANPVMAGDVLQGVAAIPDTTGQWAVGYTFDYHPLIETHSGTTPGTWSVVKNPRVVGVLNAVAARSQLNAWAVGGQADRNGNTITLAEHWSGGSWNIVKTPNPDPYDNAFHAVAISGRRDVWAVGQQTTCECQPLVEHWDGRSWSVVPTPVDGSRTFLGAVASVPGSDEVWIVGESQDANFNSYPLFLHWNGIGWDPPQTTSQPVPHLGEIGGVAAVSDADIWAVGFQYDDQGVDLTLTVHWDGSSWSVVPSPNAVDRSRLLAVTALSDGTVWAVGFHWDFVTSQTFAMGWDGTEWIIDPTPNIGTNDQLLGVAPGVSPGTVWAVGSHNACSSQSVPCTLAMVRV